MSTVVSEKIDNVISFAESLIGVKYVRWEKRKDYNFHCDELPSLDRLKMEGCVVPASLIY